MRWIFLWPTKEADICKCRRSRSEFVIGRVYVDLYLSFTYGQIALSQWETSLQSNVVSHWLGAIHFCLQDIAPGCSVHCLRFVLTGIAISLRVTPVNGWTMTIMSKYIKVIHMHLYDHDKNGHCMHVYKVYCLTLYLLVTEAYDILAIIFYWPWDGASSCNVYCVRQCLIYLMVNNIAGDSLAKKISQWLL